MAKPEHEIVTSLRLPSGLHESFKALAAREHRSLSQQLRLLIEQAVEQREAA